MFSIGTFASETMGLGERATELAESKAKSLKDDEVVVSLNSDDPDCLNDVSGLMMTNQSPSLACKIVLACV